MNNTVEAQQGTSVPYEDWQALYEDWKRAEDHAHALEAKLTKVRLYAEWRQDSRNLRNRTVGTELLTILDGEPQT